MTPNEMREMKCPKCGADYRETRGTGTAMFECGSMFAMDGDNGPYCCDETDKCEVLRLKAGRFTAEEINNICHNLHGTVDAHGFAAGCRVEQRKLYGCAPDADEMERLQRENERLEATIDKLEDILERTETKLGQVEEKLEQLMDKEQADGE